MGACGAAFPDITTISTAFTEFSSRLFSKDHEVPPVSGSVPDSRDESNEGGVVCKLEQLDRLAGPAAAAVQGEEERRKNAALVDQRAASSYILLPV